jgi:23S rRNA pseudouridine2605 synthase
MRVRLHKALAGAGVASRRRAEELIAAGRVTVNGSPAQLGSTIEPGVDDVAVDGVAVELKATRLYIALDKPRGATTTRSDPHAELTVMDVVLPALRSTPGIEAAAISGLLPIGRLDRDTDGLLLLTNDGELTQALTHPSRHVARVYHAVVEGTPGSHVLRRLRTGVPLDGRITSPAGARVIERARDGSWSLVEMTLHEGRKRQVRRMLASVGHPVLELTRIAVGPVALGDLRGQRWRILSFREVQELRVAAGLEAEEAVDQAGKERRVGRPKPAGRDGPGASPGARQRSRGSAPGPSRTERPSRERPGGGPSTRERA